MHQYKTDNVFVHVCGTIKDGKRQKIAKKLDYLIVTTTTDKELLTNRYLLRNSFRFMYYFYSYP